METSFEDMTNSELKEACADFGLEVIAKNPQKPNKAEYLTALGEFKAAQDNVHKERNAEKAEAEKAAPVKDGSTRKPQSKSVLTKLDLMAKERVIVQDMQETQTKDELISVSWGNRLIGMQTDWVDLSGEPQYVRRGALQNLRDATMTIQNPKKSGSGGVSKNQKKRFVVIPQEPLTQKELDQLASVQKMRNSKMA